MREVESNIKEGNDKKKQIDEAIGGITKKGKEVKDKITSIKRSVGFGSEADVDAKIREIEHAMMTAPVTMKEEKLLINQIKELKESKSEVGKLDDLRNDSALDTSSIEPLRKELNETRDELTKLFNTKKELREKLTEVQTEWDSNNAPVKAALEKKNNFRKELNELNKKKMQVRQEMDDETRRFRKAQQEQKRAREQQMRDERAKKAHEDGVNRLKIQLEDQQSEPYSYELVKMKVAKTYLKSLYAGHGPADEAETPKAEVDAKPEESASGAALLTKDGEEIVVPKKMRVQETYVTRQKKNKGKKKSEAPKKNKALTHEITIMSDFQKMDVPLPLWAENIPSSLEVLDKKIVVLEKAHEKEVSKWQKKRNIIERQLAALEAGKSLEEVKAIGKEAKELDEQDAAVETSATEAIGESTVKPEEATGSADLPKTDTGSTDANPEYPPGTTPMPADMSLESTPAEPMEEAPEEESKVDDAFSVETPNIDETVEEDTKIDSVKSSNVAAPVSAAEPPANISSSDDSSDSEDSA
eukprot:Selendium_serpulae@DN5923_c0_g1_i4.p1